MESLENVYRHIQLCTYNNNDKNNIFNIAIIMRENTPTKKALRLKDSLRKRESRAKEETSNLQNQKNSHRNDKLSMPI